MSANFVQLSIGWHGSISDSDLSHPAVLALFGIYLLWAVGLIEKREERVHEFD